MTVKEEVHQLIEQLPACDLLVARRVLRGLALTQERKETDTLATFLESCPEDDEPTTEEDLAAVEGGRRALSRGELIAHDAVVARSVGNAP